MSEDAAAAKSEWLEALQQSLYWLREYNGAMESEQAEHSEVCELLSHMQYMQQALPPGLMVGQPAASSHQPAGAPTPGSF